MNLDRPPLLAALREATVRDKVSALRKKRIGPAGWTPHWFRHSHATALLLAGTPEWVVSRRLGHAHVQTTLDLYGWVREDEALRAAANWKSYISALAGRPMADEQRHLHAVPTTSIRSGDSGTELPGPVAGAVIGTGIENWAKITEKAIGSIGPERIARRDRRRAGLDGALAGHGRHPLLGAGRQPVREHPAAGDPRSAPSPPRSGPWTGDTRRRCSGWFYATRWGRLPFRAAARPGAG